MPATECFAPLHREHEALVEGLKRELSAFARQPNLDYVWNIERYEQIVARATTIPLRYDKIQGAIVRVSVSRNGDKPRVVGDALRPWWERWPQPLRRTGDSPPTRG